MVRTLPRESSIDSHPLVQSIYSTPLTGLSRLEGLIIDLLVRVRHWLCLYEHLRHPGRCTRACILHYNFLSPNPASSTLRSLASRSSLSHFRITLDLIAESLFHHPSLTFTVSHRKSTLCVTRGTQPLFNLPTSPYSNQRLRTGGHDPLP